ncbi:hypothetical protein [Maricaulis sp.]|uniref:hypothetical protein n=1 Tax=Maricaulis sp. TaxID=1486257 RepID=UPI003A905B55
MEEFSIQGIERLAAILSDAPTDVRIVSTPFDWQSFGVGIASLCVAVLGAFGGAWWGAKTTAELQREILLTDAAERLRAEREAAAHRLFYWFLVLVNEIFAIASTLDRMVTDGADLPSEERWRTVRQILAAVEPNGPEPESLSLLSQTGHRVTADRLMNLFRGARAMTALIDRFNASRDEMERHARPYSDFGASATRAGAFSGQLKIDPKEDPDLHYWVLIVKHLVADLIASTGQVANLAEELVDEMNAVLQRIWETYDLPDKPLSIAMPSERD